MTIQFENIENDPTYGALLLTEFLEYDFESLKKYIDKYDNNSFVNDFYKGQLLDSNKMSLNKIVGNVILYSATEVNRYIDTSECNELGNIFWEEAPSFILKRLTDYNITVKDRKFFNVELLLGENKIIDPEELSYFPKAYKAVIKYFINTKVTNLQSSIINIIKDKDKVLDYLKDKNYKVSINFIINKDKRISEGLVFNDVYSMCYWALSKFVLNDIKVVNCKNCGKFFVPLSRKDEIYCDRVIKGDKTCKSVGYENKIKSDEVMRAYRTAYKTKNAYKNRNKNNIKDIESIFQKWVSQAKVMMDKTNNGSTTLNEFREWLNQKL